jgi:hypothetical protein
MNDQERADWLARAIDDLIKGEKPQNAAGELDDSELQALLRIAKARLQSGDAAARASVNYEGSVWQEVITRLEHAQGAANSAPVLNDAESRELGEIIALRRQISREITTFAEEHREDVWKRVEERVRGTEEPRRPRLPFGRASRTPAAETPSVAGVYPTGDPELDSLVRAALARSAAPGTADASGKTMTGRLNADRHRWPETVAEVPDPKAGTWPKVAGLVAAAAVMVAAIGPLPVTGLARHPAVEAADDLTVRLGITESSKLPPVPPADPLRVQSVEVTVPEAQVLLGLPAVAPEDVPGFTLTASRYFPAPITASAGGVLALTYESAGGPGTLMVYQESAGGPNLVAAGGSVTDLEIAGLQASYFEGGWELEDGSLAWGDTDSQSLVFEREGLRTIIDYSGPPVDPQALVETASQMVAGGVP